MTSDSPRPQWPFPLVIAAGLLAMGFGMTFWPSAEAMRGDALPVTIFLVGLVGVIWHSTPRWLPRLSRRLEAHTEALATAAEQRPGAWIVGASGMALFMELMVIRWQATDFALFGFFKNISLLACFLGLGLGFSQGRRRPLAVPLVLPALTLQFLVMHVLSVTPLQYLLQNPISEQETMGLMTVSAISQATFIFGFLVVVFAVTAWTFMPLGHLVSWLMAPLPKLRAYSLNLVGSLGGVLLFYLTSMLWTPPSVWMLLAFIGLWPFLQPRMMAWPSLVGVGLLVLVLLVPGSELNVTYIHTPYQVLAVRFNRSAPPSVNVNHFYFQQIVDFNDPASASTVRYYNLAYDLKSNIRDVLILGAGTGNDVTAAIRHPVTDVDAVEIDPALLSLGGSLHPQMPYQDPRVHAINDDARHYMRHTDKRYDLIAFGLLDSHTLLSGGTSVRLDSYVYTVESFRQARALLKSDGVIAVSFATTSLAQQKKLYLMLQQAFDGRAPRVYQIWLGVPGTTYMVGPGQDALASTNEQDVGATIAGLPDRADPSTDDWPFFYMPIRTYPWSYLVMIVVLLVTAAIIMWQQRPAESLAAFSWPCAFLGAGFMLIETKGITELALVFGSTWQVVGVVIAGILILGYLANLVVMRWPQQPRILVYTGLLLSIGVGLWATTLSGLPFERLLMPLLLTLPLFFSGLAFSDALERSTDVSSALSANLFGAMIGGLLEYNAMYFGYHSLYFIAMAMYLGAWATSTRYR